MSCALLMIPCQNLLHPTALLFHTIRNCCAHRTILLFLDVEYTAANIEILIFPNVFQVFCLVLHTFVVEQSKSLRILWPPTCFAWLYDFCLGQVVPVLQQKTFIRVPVHDDINLLQISVMLWLFQPQHVVYNRCKSSVLGYYHIHECFSSLGGRFISTFLH